MGVTDCTKASVARDRWPQTFEHALPWPPPSRTCPSSCDSFCSSLSQTARRPGICTALARSSSTPKL
eukprot:1066487-Prymnesium_polylepis.1